MLLPEFLPRVPLVKNMFACVCLNTRSQLQVPFFKSNLHCIWRHSFSLKLELADLAELVGQQALGLPYLPSQPQTL